MSRIFFIINIIIGFISMCTTATAQSNIDPINKHAWGENIGWLNWRDANVTSQGAVVSITFFSGFVWGENIGWLTVGDGSPANGTAYSNTSGADSGINILSSGFLEGLAWGENVGWVNFGTEPFVGAALGARYNQGRLTGFAWGENVGWINLDLTTNEQFVSLNCPADFNNDNIVDGTDLLILLNVIGTSNPRIDLNGDGVVDGVDLLFILNAFGPCP